MLHISSIF